MIEIKGKRIGKKQKRLHYCVHFKLKNIILISEKNK